MWLAMRSRCDTIGGEANLISIYTHMTKGICSRLTSSNMAGSSSISSRASLPVVVY